MNIDKQEKGCLISRYIENLNKTVDCKDRLFFRGQSDSTWPLTSNAYRRLAINRNQNSIDHSIFVEYNIDLVEKAKLNGYDYKDFRKLKDLELLAEIQHYEGATCLIDFTENFLVALWFASTIPVVDEKEKDVNGRVLIIQNKKNNEILQKISSKEIDETIDVILKFEKKKMEISPAPLGSSLRHQNYKYWIWEPEGLNNRILQQDSVFIFGKPIIEKDDYSEIIVDKKDKKEIQEELIKYFNINSDTLFKDIHGFASKANSVKNVWYSNDPNDNKHVAHNIFERASSLLEEFDYEKALAEFNKAINLYSEDEEFFIQRGQTFFQLERFTESIKDFEMANSINKNSIQDWNTYFHLGNIQLILKHYDQAENYFKMSIELIPDSHYSKLGMGYIHFSKQEYTKAIEVYNETLKTTDPFYHGQIHALIAEAEGKLGNYTVMVKEFKNAFSLDYSDLNINIDTFEASLIGGNKTAFNLMKEILNKNQNRIYYLSMFKILSAIGEYLYFDLPFNTDFLLTEIRNEFLKTGKKIEWSFIELENWLIIDSEIYPDKKIVIGRILVQVQETIIKTQSA